MVKISPWLYNIIRAILGGLLFLFTDWHVRGRENVPREGAMVVVANHLNLADPPLLAYALGRKAVFMAKEELYRNPLLSYVIRRIGSFPVRRGKLSREVLRQAGDVLGSGLMLAVFPEGGRSRNGQLQAAFSGAALIALHNCVPVLPVGISGTEKIKGLGWLLRRPCLTVNIGRPFSLPSVDGKMTKEELAGLTDEIMGRIAELLPEDYRGDYARSKVPVHED